jgi:zinc D-Ala-D-Ala carboxypeptidase
MKAVYLLIFAGLFGGGGALAWSQFADNDVVVVASVEVLNDDERATTAAPPPIDVADNLAVAPADTTIAATLADTPTTTSAATPRLCNGELSPEAPTADGRLFGHFAYAEASDASLVAPPAGFGGGNCQQVHSSAAVQLDALIKAAKAQGISLTGLSCFRSISYQRSVFCNAGKLASQGGVKGRARSSAPPGYSEHATGYALDFGDRANPGTNLEASFGGTKAGKWLAANARSFGYEMSFPSGNAQGVTFEPWHFRWVGNAPAKATFATARSEFPGQ